MFSSFSSFLPSVLQPGQEQRSHQSLPAPNNDTAVADANSQPLDYTSYSDSKSKKKDKREKLVNEARLTVLSQSERLNNISFRHSLLCDLHLVNQIIRSISRFNLYLHNLVTIDHMRLSRLLTSQLKIQLTPLLIPLIFKERILAGQIRLRSQLTHLHPL